NEHIIRQLGQGEAATVVGGPDDVDGHTWWQLLIGEQTGWCAGEFLTALSVEDHPAAVLDPRVLEIRQWIPLDAPTQNQPRERSVESYQAVIEQFGVETNPRYRPHDGLTFCNIFVSDVTRAMHAPIPHRVNANGDPDDGGRELNVAGMVAWVR